MRIALSAGLIVIAAAAAGHAQEASIPDVVGVWSGPWRTVIYGNNSHHPGTETVEVAPRVREITFTMHFEGQDGRLLWGRSWSDPASPEPFAGTISWDGKRIMGADTDGSLDIEIVSNDRMEACYAHTALGPAEAIVATCGTMTKE